MKGLVLVKLIKKTPIFETLVVYSARNKYLSKWIPADISEDSC